MGETLVTVSTTDEAGNANQCSFKVTVSKQAPQPEPTPTPTPTPPTGAEQPAQGCGCTSSSVGVNATWGLVLMAVSRRRRMHPRD